MSEVVIYYTPWCGDCRVAKRVFAQNDIDYQMINIEDDVDAQRKVQEINGGYKSVPTIIFPSGAVIVEPSAVELTVALKREGLLTTA